jgi:hypothetical protein
MKGAAIIAVVLLAVVAVFQIALALGAPLGKAAWGGQHDAGLPRSLRIASAVAGAVIYPLIILLVMVSSDLVTAGWLPGTGQTVMWALAGLFTIGALGNFASRSKIERIWGPVSLGIAVCCGVIAVGI